MTRADGSQAVAVASDPARWAWKGLSASETTRNNVYLGERVDGATQRALGLLPGLAQALDHRFCFVLVQGAALVLVV